MTDLDAFLAQPDADLVQMFTLPAVKGGGPVHREASRSLSQAWCGVRRQFRHVGRVGSPDEVTCAKCLRQIAKGRSAAHRSKG